MSRICLISDFFPPRYSGAGRNACELARQLVRMGHKVLVLTSSRPGLSQEETVDGVQILRVAPFKPGLAGIFTYSLRLASKLLNRHGEFDLVHFFSGYKTVYLPLLILKMLGKPSVVNSSSLGGPGGDDLQTIRESKFGWVRLRLLSLNSSYISLSPAITARCKSIDNSPPLYEIPNGVNTERFCPASRERRLELRRAFSLPESGFVGCFVGSVNRDKGVDLFIKAWGKIASELPDSTLFVIGPQQKHVNGRDTNKDFSEWLDQFVRKNGLKESVRFLQTREVEHYLQASDVFVFPSRREGVPNAVLEAMACGLPVVTCPADWLVDLVEDEVNGLITHRVDPGEIAQILLKLAANPQLGSKLGKRGRERVLEKYSIQVQAKKCMSLYLQMIANRSNQAVGKRVLSG